LSICCLEEDEQTINSTVSEGAVVYKRHKSLERNRSITKKKKEQVLKTKGKLACEVCDFDFSERYGEFGTGFIECHHIKPLSEIGGVTETALKDLALLCANCHRIIHRHINRFSVEELRQFLIKE
jgi:5-methylcytosine-specific restriction enzyme A